MNQSELERLLKQLETPTPPAGDAVERAIQKARATFSAEPLRLNGAEQTDGRPDLLRDLLPSLLGALLLLALWWKFDPSNRGGLNSSKTLALVTSELREIMQVFPDELVGVVDTMGQSKVILEPSSGPRGGQPLAVDITRNGHRTRILTFSGKKLEVDIAAERLKLAFLASPDGKIEVASEKFVWQNDTNSYADGYRIEARTLDIKG